jgi:hypothetical protein
MTKKEIINRVQEILHGIDKDEVEEPDGWWETGAGAEFGKERLNLIIELLQRELP